MNSFNALLLITSSLSSSLYSMEQSVMIQQKTLETLTKNDHDDILKLYQDTSKALDALTMPSGTITDNINVDNANAERLLSIITQTKRLKVYGINELLIGKIAFQQEPFIKNKLLNHTSPPYNGPHYVSVFFARLSQYNKLLTQKVLTTPTIKQYKQYQHEQKIVAAIRKATYFNLTIEHNTQINDTTLIAAAQEFDQLIADIWKMRNTQPSTIETIAIKSYGTTDTHK